MKPLPFTPTGVRPWFWDEPLPKTKLQTMVKDMFRDAGIEGRFTNHSLRVSGTTALFDAGVPESIIQKRTGHKSVSALHQYKRVTTTQNQMVANILQPDTVDSTSKGEPQKVKLEPLTPTKLSAADPHATVDAVIASVSPPKNSKTNYFDGEITDGETVTRIIGFDKTQKTLLNRFRQKGGDSSNS